MKTMAKQFIKIFNKFTKENMSKFKRNLQLVIEKMSRCENNFRMLKKSVLKRDETQLITELKD